MTDLETLAVRVEALEKKMTLHIGGYEKAMSEMNGKVAEVHLDYAAKCAAILTALRGS